MSPGRRVRGGPRAPPAPPLERAAGIRLIRFESLLYDRSIRLRSRPGMLKTTPFHVRTAPLVLCATWRRWAGHAVASAYDWTHEREYAAVRNAAALFDVSPLHKYRSEEHTSEHQSRVDLVCRLLLEK